jgi:hypothetical protein
MNLEGNYSNSMLLGMIFREIMAEIPGSPSDSCHLGSYRYLLFE